jgi:hypothetical protein
MDAGVNTVKDLKISVGSLKSAGFRIGHIAEVRWAAGDMTFASSTNTPRPLNLLAGKHATSSWAISTLILPRRDRGGRRCWWSYRW